jgi:glycosyltransferase involved in cell wall biosynthesis
MNLAQAGRIGFLVKTYPKVSETFILGEILGLESEAVPLHIFSLQRPTDQVFHSATQTVRAPVSYILAPAWSRTLALLREQAVLFFSGPRRYLSALVLALRHGENSKVKTFLHAGSLAAQAREANVSHFHAHFASEPASVAELAHRLTGITFSISAHAKDIYLSSAAALRRKLHAAAFTVTCTEYNRRHLSMVAGAGARVLRMYHGIDTAHFHTPSKALDSPRVEPPLILSVGRLREKKGFPTLLAACQQLAASGVRFQCQIVGYGPDAAALQSRIESLGLRDFVKLAGKLTHDQLIERYRAATLFVLPCQIAADGDRDGIPNVLLEAMSMQLPVVSTDVSGIPEVVHHEHNGLLIAPEDPAALAAAINRLLADAKLRAQLGATARQTVRAQFANGANLKLLRDLLLEASHASLTQRLPPPRRGEATRVNPASRKSSTYNC